MTKHMETFLKAVIPGMALILVIGIAWLFSFILVYWWSTDFSWSAFHQQFLSNLPLFVVVVLSVLGAFLLVPAHDRDIAHSLAMH